MKIKKLKLQVQQRNKASTETRAPTAPASTPLETTQELFNSPLSAKLKEIEDYLATEGDLPIQTLRLACKQVMIYLKDNEDSVLQLEPEDRALIIKAMKRGASAETQAIFAKKKKRTSKKKTKQVADTQRILKELKNKRPIGGMSAEEDDF